MLSLDFRHECTTVMVLRAADVEIVAFELWTWFELGALDPLWVRLHGLGTLPLKNSMPMLAISNLQLRQNAALLVDCLTNIGFTLYVFYPFHRCSFSSSTLKQYRMPFASKALRLYLHRAYKFT